MGNAASDSNRGVSISIDEENLTSCSINPEQADILIEHLRQFMNSVLDDFKEKLVKHQVGTRKTGEAADELITAIESESDEVHTGMELGCRDELHTAVELRSDELSTAVEIDSNEEIATAVGLGPMDSSASDDQLLAAIELGSEYQPRAAVELGSDELRAVVDLGAIDQLRTAVESCSSGQLLTAIEYGSLL
uniref:Uncharacterized protein n=1 Tax=Ditylenchus dipsaci TaxID=166011 RepID=A0A915EFV9_9BILA